MIRFTILGNAPSENHMWHKAKNRYGATINIYKPDAQAWFDNARLVARMAARKFGWKMPQKGEWVVMRVWYVFANKTHPDPSNTFKALLDALQGELYPNDKYVLPRAMSVQYDTSNPRIELELEVMEG